MKERNEGRPFDLAIAGELNLDLILYGLPTVMETERDLIGTAFVTTLGSSSAIVAHNAAKLGSRVRFATLVGDDDFGRIALRRLQEAGVETSGAKRDGTTATGVTIVLPHGSERHSLSYLGCIAALSVDHLDLRSLAEARHFHLSSLYLQTGLHQGLPDLLRYLRSAGLTISLDTNDDPENRWGEPLHAILPLVDLFLPSEGELCRMAGGCALEEAMALFGAKVPVLVVKRGRNGCTVKRGADWIDLPGLSVSPVDTIGAGDSFDAGFLHAYLMGLDVMACARAGNICGALATQGAGGTEAFRDDAARSSFLRKHDFPMA